VVGQAKKQTAEKIKKHDNKIIRHGWSASASQNENARTDDCEEWTHAMNSAYACFVLSCACDLMQLIERKLVSAHDVGLPHIVGENACACAFEGKGEALKRKCQR
jgi:hypothetical protein